MSSNPKEMTKQLMNSISTLKEPTIMMILIVIIFVIIFIALLYFFYMRNLPKYECNAMDALYSTINGKIRS